MRLFPLLLGMACAPGTAVTKYDVADNDVVSDSGVLDTATTGEPSSEPAGEPSTEPNSDNDGDGFTPSNGDCDDGNADVNPDAQEVENGFDDDCNGIIDEGTNSYDDDGDGYSENDGDCNDGNPNVSPGALEVVDDGVDQDCSGADLSCNNTTEISWSADFPATGTGSCDWGNNGNLPDEQGQISARREQEAVYTVPDGSAICAVRPAFQSNQGGYQTTFNFDDDVMLVYNDYVLFSTNEYLVDPLQSGNWQGKLYDWDLMKGAALSGWTWEWGSSFASVGSGQFYLSMQNNKMNRLADLSLVNGEIRMMLVTFGDNDNEDDSDGADCFHEGLSIPVEIELAQ